MGRNVRLGCVQIYYKTIVGNIRHFIHIVKFRARFRSEEDRSLIVRSRRENLGKNNCLTNNDMVKTGLPQFNVPPNVLFKMKSIFQLFIKEKFIQQSNLLNSIL